MTIKKRIRNHYNSTHNDYFDLWLRSSYDLYFQYENITNINAITAKERNRIKELSPLTNKRLI